MESVRCNRCGKCCYIRWKGKKKKCKYLIRFTNVTVCRIYDNRLGNKMGEIDGKKFHCVDREVVLDDFAGCPYNKGRNLVE